MAGAFVTNDAFGDKAIDRPRTLRVNAPRGSSQEQFPLGVKCSEKSVSQRRSSLLLTNRRLTRFPVVVAVRGASAGGGPEHLRSLAGGGSKGVASEDDAAPSGFVRRALRGSRARC